MNHEFRKVFFIESEVDGITIFFSEWINKDFLHVQGSKCASEVPNLIGLLRL